MRRAFLAAAAFAGVVAASAQPPSGTFQRDHEVKLGDQSVTVLDRLTLKPGGEKKISFTVNSIGNEYDACKLTGTANETAPNVYEFTQRLHSYDNALCRLRIRVGRDRITLEDAGGACRPMYCGANAALDGLWFPYSGKAAPPKTPAKKKKPRAKK